MLTAEQIAQELDKAMERSVTSVASEYATDATGLTWYLRMLEQKWNNANEALQCRFRDICNGPAVERHPLFRAVQELEIFITELERHLPPAEQAKWRAGFDKRVDAWCDAWRQKHGFLTEAEMVEMYARYGTDNCLIDGFLAVLTHDEARDIAARFPARLVAAAS